ncbi:hypothetical protein FE249_20475 (plasmid) [Acidiphilium multivorum]|uniref:hypothetical protein n=1 Tax=Acidiphilium multivorum TaxID=62140 RepID=UPI001F4C3AB6|nr:hypothetical protein [Acidiphilium multivorum]UNC16554.1 hypothetical protein FE249_20475 [Acidiphilium multivorum]
MNLRLGVLLMCATPLVLSACSNKKDTYKQGMVAWLKSHPKAARYCTQIGLPTKIGNTEVIAMGPPGFYLPSKAFSNTAEHPLLAIVDASMSENPAFAEMEKRGLIRAENVMYVKEQTTFFTGPATYINDPRVAYVLLKPRGFQLSKQNIKVGYAPKVQGGPPEIKGAAVSAVSLDSLDFAPNWCGGKITISKVLQYTPPSAENGQTVSLVTAAAELSGLPSWISDPKIESVLQVKPKKTFNLQAVFEKTSNGWLISSPVQMKPGNS